MPASFWTQITSPTRSHRLHPFISALFALTLAGVAARLLLSWHSLGSDDWRTWERFATKISDGGLFWAYAWDRDLNHPPLPALWSAAALDLSHTQVARGLGASFPFIFRLPMILADAGTCVLLWRIWRGRRDSPVAGWAAAAAFAWNLDAVLVGSFHCNTDNLCAFFALLAAYLVASRGSFIGGGLALAASINVKLVPVLLVPVLLSLCRDRRDVRRFLAGLAVGALPFVPVIVFAGNKFARNALAYTPVSGEWGLMLLLPSRAAEWYYVWGKGVLLAAVAALAVASWRWRRWDAYRLAAITLALFLLLTPGFGVQYTVYVVPVLLAVDLRWGSVYGLLAGACLLVAYAGGWAGGLPLESRMQRLEPPAPLLGLLAWGVLAAFVARTLRRALSRARRPLTARATPPPSAAGP